MRVDASTDIGTGHFMRCLALADALKARGAAVRFLSRHLPPELATLAGRAGHAIVALDAPAQAETQAPLPHSAWLGTARAADARSSAQALADATWDWLVVDHYALDRTWESALRGSAKRILAIDDLADRDHDCDILLDQNHYADGKARYARKVPAACRVLLGPRYALLRAEFARLRAKLAPHDGQIRRVLIFFGGIDGGGHTPEAIEALAGLRGTMAVDVVVGAQHARQAEIEARCKALGFACHVQTDRMAELMAAADLAVGAGGTAFWERCCLGLPALVRAVAANQERLVEEAALAGLVYAPNFRRGSSLADHVVALSENPRLIRALSRNGMAAVDGRGTARVARAMGFGALQVRRASPSDSTQVFAWRNHPKTRAASRDPRPLERVEHDAWFAATLASDDRLLLIGEQEGTDVGVVRFDVNNSAAEISIYVAPARIGNGEGIELLLAAEAWLAANRPDVAELQAEVLRDNEGSHALFLAGGYQLASARYVKRVQ